MTDWSINPALPAGLTFDTARGTISGTPTAESASGSYVVTAENSGGKTTATLTIEVDAGPLLELGHNAGLALLRMSGSSVFSLDYSGHWALWDYTTAAEIASDDLDCAPGCNLTTGPHVADMIGETLVLETRSGFEIRSAITGDVLSSITAAPTWWSLASDGSYLVAGSSGGLSAWYPSGNSLLFLSGDYSKAAAFATPGQIQVAGGPSGQSVIQTGAVPGAGATTGTPFNGQFSSWFLDGSRFITTAGSTALIYSQASAQQAVITLPGGAASAVGQGNWVWTVSGSTLDVFAATVTSSTPAATFAIADPSRPEIPSGSTIALLNSAGQISVIDLSGPTPTESNFALPIYIGTAFAATSASQWVFGNGSGVLLDGASLGGTPRYFDYGEAWSIAGSNGSIAVATASGRIVCFDSATLTQEGVISDLASKVLLSSDGSVLVAAGDENDLQYNDDWSINVYSLPGAGLLYTWPYSYSNHVLPQDVALSGTGTVLGRVLFTLGASSYTQEANPTTGGPAIFSSTFNSSTTQPMPPPIRISPDGSLIATSTNVASSGVNPGTNILQNGNLVTAVTGFPVGWIDDGHLVVNTYAPKVIGGVNYDGSQYAGCMVYSPTGQSTGPCALPDVAAFQRVTSDNIYAVDLAEVVSVSTGDVSWTSGDTASQSVASVAGNRVVFVSGTQVLAQGY